MCVQDVRMARSARRSVETYTMPADGFLYLRSPNTLAMVYCQSPGGTGKIGWLTSLSSSVAAVAATDINVPGITTSVHTWQTLMGDAAAGLAVIGDEAEVVTVTRWDWPAEVMAELYKPING